MVLTMEVAFDRNLENMLFTKLVLRTSTTFTASQFATNQFPNKFGTARVL